MRRVCVFCGSSPGASPRYLAATNSLGVLLAQRGLGLVYGGASIGLMGKLADAVLAEGGEVIGVIPSAMVTKEVAHAGLLDLRVVDSMHERKALMADLSDAFIALPGGIGTLEELLEILTWSQLGIHDKPCGVLNVRGYFDALLALLDHVVAERFMRPEHRAMLLAEPTAEALLDAFERYEVPLREKWLDRDET